MHKKISNTILLDYLNDRLSEQERVQFIALYSDLLQENQEEASEVFDQLLTQMEGLSAEELKRFTAKIEATKARKENIRPLRRKNITNYLKYAAAVLLTLSIGYWFMNHLNTNDQVQYIAKSDQLIWLPDSSSALLKAGSTLSFNPSFNQHARQVTLTGEAFFNVKPNPEKVFTVSSPRGFYTKVLGTSFLISTTDSLNTVEVKTGKVQVGNSSEVLGILLPGDRLINDQYGQTTISHHQSAPSETLQFENQELQSITQALAARYGRDIVLTPDVPNGLICTATFSSHQSLEEIIQILCELHHLKYTLQDRSILISK